MDVDRKGLKRGVPEEATIWSQHSGHGRSPNQHAAVDAVRKRNCDGSQPNEERWQPITKLS